MVNRWFIIIKGLLNEKTQFTIQFKDGDLIINFLNKKWMIIDYGSSALLKEQGLNNKIREYYFYYEDIQDIKRKD